MTTPYHEGELAVQARAGVQGMASRVGRSIAPKMTPTLQAFLAQQTFLVAALIDTSQHVWASILTGTSGFVHPLDAHTLVVYAQLHKLGPLRDTLGLGAPIGLLAIDLASRKRVRVNGTVTHVQEDAFTLHVEQAYGNCLKYIQKRDVEPSNSQENDASSHIGSVLSTKQHTLIEHADTFFIATTHPNVGADASHRGGNRGFVRVLDDRRLEFPDYAGNNMFNTLGNIAANGRAGLLFLDFERDRMLQLTGTAHIVWDEARRASHPGAERLVAFELEHVIERQSVTNRTWWLRELSPYNPA